MAGIHNDNNKPSDKEIKLKELMEEFLKANGIEKKKEDTEKDGWYELMVENNVGMRLKEVLEKPGLKQYFEGKETYSKTEPNSRVPAYNRVLKAFTLVRPEEVKVLVIGTSPALSVGDKGGVAFSGPGTRDPEAGQNQNDGAVKKFRDALEKGLVENDPKKTGLIDISFNLERWAETNKVLLLNAGLTMTNKNENKKKKRRNFNTEDKDKIEENCELWKDFMKQLLKAWRKSRMPTKQQEGASICPPDNEEQHEKNTSTMEMLNLKDDTVHILLLGYEDSSPSRNSKPHYSKDVWDVSEEDEAFNVEKDVHHPTFPTERMKEENNFSTEAPKFFKNAFSLDTGPPKN